MLQDLGAWGTPLLYAFREREKILDLFEARERLADDVQLFPIRRRARGFRRADD